MFKQKGRPIWHRLQHGCFVENRLSGAEGTTRETSLESTAIIQAKDDVVWTKFVGMGWGGVVPF